MSELLWRFLAGAGLAIVVVLWAISLLYLLIAGTDGGSGYYLIGALLLFAAGMGVANVLWFVP